MKKIRVIIANNNYLILKGLIALLTENREFEFLAEVADKDELEQVARTLKPDVVVIDFSDEKFKLDALVMLNKVFPFTRVMAITPEIPSDMMAKALNTGLVSYILNRCSREEIIEALFSADKGHRFLCGKIADRLVTPSPAAGTTEENTIAKCDGLKITDRELEVIGLIAEGLSNKEIAVRLFISTHTVTTHRRNIMSKLGVSNSAGVVMFAVRENLLESDKFLLSGTQ